jgi:hypothetical protein
MAKYIAALRNPRQLFANIENPILRYGLIWGLALGVLQILLGFILNLVASAASLGVYVALAASIIFPFLAAQKTAQACGVFLKGLLGGLLAGVLGYAMVGIASFIQDAIFVDYIVNYYKTHPETGVNPATYTRSFVLTNVAETLLAALIFYAFIALFGSALGSFLGKRRYTYAYKYVAPSDDVVPDAMPEAIISDGSTKGDDASVEHVKEEVD